MDFEEEIKDGKYYLRIGGKLFQMDGGEVTIPYDQIPDVSYKDLPDGIPVEIIGKDLDVVFQSGGENDTVIARFYWNKKDTGFGISVMAFDKIFDLLNRTQRRYLALLKLIIKEYSDDSIFFSATVEITKKSFPEIFHEVCTMLDEIMKPIKDIEAMIESTCDELERMAENQQ